MAMQKRLVQMAIGKQSALGTPATGGQFKFGVQDGAAVKVDADEQVLDTTWSTRLVEGFERLTVTPGAEYGFVATRQLIGQHLFFALGGDVVTGTAPYLHTITEAEPLPIATLFGRAASDYLIVPDARLDQLELSFERTGALKGKATWLGTDVSDSTTAWTTSGQDERVQSGYFNMGGGAFTIDGLSSRIQKGTITIKNDHKPIQPAFQVTPDDYMAGILSLDYSFTLLPDDYGEWRKHIYNSASLPAAPGTIAFVPHYASISQTWKSAADTLILSAPEVKTTVAFPEAALEGGPVEMEVAGSTAINLSGQAITWALENETAAYT